MIKSYIFYVGGYLVTSGREEALIIGSCNSFVIFTNNFVNQVETYYLFLLWGVNYVLI
jgi:hypothetical protein